MYAANGAKKKISTASPKFLCHKRIFRLWTNCADLSMRCPPDDTSCTTWYSKSRVMLWLRSVPLSVLCHCCCVHEGIASKHRRFGPKVQTRSHRRKALSQLWANIFSRENVLYHACHGPGLDYSPWVRLGLRTFKTYFFRFFQRRLGQQECSHRSWWTRIRSAACTCRTSWWHASSRCCLRWPNWRWAWNCLQADAQPCLKLHVLSWPIFPVHKRPMCFP